MDGLQMQMGPDNVLDEAIVNVLCHHLPLLFLQVQ